jgi:hypothetical protein
MTPGPSTDVLTGLLLAEIPRRFPPGTRCWKSGVLVGRALHDERLLRAGLPGQSDISGIMAPSGRYLAVEVKARKDRMHEKQEAFRAMILRAGGIHVIARDLEQAIKDIEGQL